MINGLQWFSVTLALAGLLALFAILAPRPRWVKCVALICTALFLPVSYLTANDLLSRPKPMATEMAKAHLRDAIVTASVLREKQAIFLWLQVQGVDEPRAYRLPWSEQMAVELHEAQREAEQEGTDVQMNMPEGEDPDGEERVFEAIKAAPPPPKET